MCQVTVPDTIPIENGKQETKDKEFKAKTKNKLLCN